MENDMPEEIYISKLGDGNLKCHGEIKGSVRYIRADTHSTPPDEAREAAFNTVVDLISRADQMIYSTEIRNAESVLVTPKPQAESVTAEDEA